jgi:hypothetical protein
MMTSGFEGKVVIVTGVSTGTGAATARHFPVLQGILPLLMLPLLLLVPQMDGRLLVARGVDANSYAESCCTRRRNKLTTSGRVHANFPLVVRFWISGLRGGDGYFLADDRPPHYSIILGLVCCASQQTAAKKH